jgi:hypothetical protein
VSETQTFARLLMAPLVAVLLGPTATGATLRAEQITEGTAAELLIGGPDAIGGVGDWYLANDVIEVIVDDPGRRHGKLNHGGTLVDAGLRDRRGEDQFARLFPVVNMDQRVFLDYDAMRAQVDQDGSWARLVVSSRGGMSSLPRSTGLARLLDPMVPEPEELRDVAVETEYAVFPGEPFVHITTTIRNRSQRPSAPHRSSPTGTSGCGAVAACARSSRTPSRRSAPSAFTTRASIARRSRPPETRWSPSRT